MIILKSGARFVAPPGILSFEIGSKPGANRNSNFWMSEVTIKKVVIFANDMATHDLLPEK